MVTINYNNLVWEFRNHDVKSYYRIAGFVYSGYLNIGLWKKLLNRQSLFHSFWYIMMSSASSAYINTHVLKHFNWF